MNSLPTERWAVPTLVVTSTLPDTLTCSCPATPHYLGMGEEGESNLPRYHMELTMTESGHVTCSLILGAAMNINELFTLCNFEKVAHCGLCSWTVLELKSGCTSVVLLCTALYCSKQFSHNILHVPLDSNVLKTKLTPSGGSLPVQAVKAPHKNTSWKYSMTVLINKLLLVRNGL